MLFLGVAFWYDFLPFLEKETSKETVLKPLLRLAEKEFTSIFPEYIFIVDFLAVFEKIEIATLVHLVETICSKSYPSEMMNVYFSF